MKKLLTIIILLLPGLIAHAQTNPDLIGTNIVGTGIPAGNPPASPFAPGEPVSFTLTFGNIGTQDMELPVAIPYEINVTLQNFGPAPVFTWTSGVNYFDPPVVTSLGVGRYIYTFKQIQNIPVGTSSTLTVSGAATKDYLSVGTYRVRYQANGSPGSYANTGGDNPGFIGLIDSTLPVTLISFKASKEGTTANLIWATTAETNSDRFEIERSLTGKEWNKIGKVDSHGESTVKNTYTFKDPSPANGENLYRLKMIDKDATFAYSHIQSVKFDGIGADLSVYPNPVADKLFIRDFSQVTQVVINDLNGRTVIQSGVSANGEVNVQNLKAGMYVIRVSRSNGVTSSQKIVVGGK